MKNNNIIIDLVKTVLTKENCDIGLKFSSDKNTYSGTQWKKLISATIKNTYPNCINEKWICDDKNNKSYYLSFNDNKNNFNIDLRFSDKYIASINRDAIYSKTPFIFLCINCKTKQLLVLDSRTLKDNYSNKIDTFLGSQQNYTTKAFYSKILKLKRPKVAKIFELNSNNEVIEVENII